MRMASRSNWGGLFALSLSIVKTNIISLHVVIFFVILHLKLIITHTILTKTTTTMKKVFTLITAIALCFTLNAQNPFEDEQVIVTPDFLHFYFHGCSPHGGLVTITNYTSEDLVVNRCYAENFNVECLYEGRNIAETGMFVPIGETVVLDTYATPTSKDVYGTLCIDTDYGIFTITIYYETTYGVEENIPTFSLSPNPANGFVTIKGENLGSVSIFNMLGQKIEDHFYEGKELVISTAHYLNGIYFAKTAQGKTQRFVIAH